MPTPGTPGIIEQMSSQHEEGEFELVLGNKQLLSVFFLVILLLGVFFSMGYIVGRNTSPPPAISASNRPPLVVESPGRSAVPPSDPTKPSALTPKPDPLHSDPPRTTPTTVADPPPARTEIKRDPPPVKPEPVKVTRTEPPKPPKPEPAKAEPVKPPKPEPVKTAKPEPVKPVKPEPVKPEPPKQASTVKGGGTYLQVVATKRPDADKVVASLAQKGFAASITPVPDSALVRVVVGPLADPAAVTKTRQGLESAGFKPIIRKF